jgi:hypothetical protein
VAGSGCPRRRAARGNPAFGTLDAALAARVIDAARHGRQRRLDPRPQLIGHDPPADSPHIPINNRRVLPDSTPLPEELADIERAAAYWGGGAQMRRRIEALQQSSACVALFLEYIPQNTCTSGWAFRSQQVTRRPRRGAANAPYQGQLLFRGG